MRTLFFVLIGASAALGICLAVCFLRRRVALGVGFSGALVGSLALGYYAATESDPPSLLPLWGWMAGLFLGAAPGLGAFFYRKRKEPPPGQPDLKHD